MVARLMDVGVVKDLVAATDLVVENAAMIGIAMTAETETAETVEEIAIVIAAVIAAATATETMIGTTAVVETGMTIGIAMVKMVIRTKGAVVMMRRRIAEEMGAKDVAMTRILIAKEEMATMTRRTTSHVRIYPLILRKGTAKAGTKIGTETTDSDILVRMRPKS